MEIYLHTHTTLCAVSKRKKKKKYIYMVYNIIGRLGRLCFYFYWEKRAARPTPNIALPTFRPQTYRVLDGFFLFLLFLSRFHFLGGNLGMAVRCVYSFVVLVVFVFFFSYFSNEVWLIFLSFGRCAHPAPIWWGLSSSIFTHVCTRESPLFYFYKKKYNSVWVLYYSVCCSIVGCCCCFSWPVGRL